MLYFFESFNFFQQWKIKNVRLNLSKKNERRTLAENSKQNSFVRSKFVKPLASKSPTTKHIKKTN